MLGTVPTGVYTFPMEARHIYIKSVTSVDDWYYFLKNHIYIYCVHWVGVCHDTYIAIRGQFSGVDYLLMPCRDPGVFRMSGMVASTLNLLSLLAISNLALLCALLMLKWSLSKNNKKLVYF